MLQTYRQLPMCPIAVTACLPQDLASALQVGHVSRSTSTRTPSSICCTTRTEPAPAVDAITNQGDFYEQRCSREHHYQSGGGKHPSHHLDQLRCHHRRLPVRL